MPWARVEETAERYRAAGAEVVLRRYPNRAQTVSREEVLLVHELLGRIAPAGPRVRGDSVTVIPQKPVHLQSVSRARHSDLRPDRGSWAPRCRRHGVGPTHESCSISMTKMDLGAPASIVADRCHLLFHVRLSPPVIIESEQHHVVPVAKAGDMAGEQIGGKSKQLSFVEPDSG